MYFFLLWFSKASRKCGRIVLKRLKIERGSISNEMLFSFSSTERALSSLFRGVFEHMHLGTLTVNGVSKQLSLSIDIKDKHLLVTMSNRSQDIASSGWLVVLSRFRKSRLRVWRGTMIKSFLGWQFERVAIHVCVKRLNKILNAHGNLTLFMAESLSLKAFYLMLFTDCRLLRRKFDLFAKASECKLVSRRKSPSILLGNPSWLLHSRLF